MIRAAVGIVGYQTKGEFCGPLPYFQVGDWTRLAVQSSCFLLTGLGPLVFLLGILTWFCTRLQGKGTVNFWRHRFWRRPQYLVWSCGVTA